MLCARGQFATLDECATPPQGRAADICLQLLLCRNLLLVERTTALRVCGANLCIEGIPCPQERVLDSQPMTSTQVAMFVQ